MHLLRGQTYLEMGRLPEAISRLQRLLLDTPTDENAACMLMLALYRRGRQTDAVAVFDDVRARLDDRGMLPSTALRRRQEQILSHDPELDRAPPLTGQGQVCDDGLHRGDGDSPERRLGAANSREPDPHPGTERLGRRSWPARLGRRLVVMQRHGTVAHGADGVRAATLGRPTSAGLELLVATRCLDAFARHDGPGIQATLADGVVFEEASGGGPTEYRGARDVTARLLRLGSYFESIEYDIRDPTVTNGVLRYDISWSGIQIRRFADGTTAGDASGVVRALPGHVATRVKLGVITHIRYGGYRDTTFDAAR